MLYVQNENKMIYQVEMKVRQASEFYYLLELNLVCGWDYISEESDRQGYVAPSNFIEDAQWESFTFYPLEETILERLKEEDFEQVDLKELQVENFLLNI